MDILMLLIAAALFGLLASMVGYSASALKHGEVGTYDRL